MTRTIWVVSAAFLFFLNQAQADDLLTKSPAGASQEIEGTRSPTPSSSSTQTGPVVGQILIGGNDRVEEEAIRVYVKSVVGEPLNEDQIDRDVRAIYNMGFFKNVEARVTEDKGRTVLTYWVSERPLLR